MKLWFRVWEVNSRNGLKICSIHWEFQVHHSEFFDILPPEVEQIKVWIRIIQRLCLKITLTWSGIRIAMNVGRGRRRKVIDPPNGWPWHTMTKSWEPLVAYASDLHWLTWVGLPRYVWQYQPIDIVKDLSWPYTWYNFSCHASCVIQRVWTLELLHLISERSKRSENSKQKGWT